MGNCLGCVDDGRNKPLPNLPHIANYSQSPSLYYATNPLPPPPTNQAHRQYVHSQPPLQQFSPVQRNTSYMPIQSPYSQEFSPIQQEFSPIQEQFSPMQQPFSPIQQEFSPIQQEFSPMQQPFSPIQQQFSPIQQEFSPIQQEFSPIQQEFSPIQQPYNHQLIDTLNPQINDTLEPDHWPNQIDPSTNVEEINNVKALSQFITKASQNFEDFGIDDVIKPILPPPPEGAFCHNCKLNKVDNDPGGFPGEYCSDECRKEAIYVGFANPICTQCKESPQVTNSQFCGWGSCRKPLLCINCKEEAYPSSPWCSIDCKVQAPNQQSLINARSDQMCIYCKKENSLTGSDFCSDDCETSIKKMVPYLLKLPPDSQKYKDITNQFTTAWKHPHKTIPEIVAIWKIFCDENLNSRYNKYRDDVENYHKLAGKNFPKGDGKRIMSAGNEQRRFHGTKTVCHIGLTGDGNICKNPKCSVCRIIKEGYKLKYVGTGIISAAFQRFGRGIYFSGTSSKSDDYNEGSLKYFQGSDYKVMILNKVVVGQGYQLTKDNMKLIEPPPGFNSILGEPSKTGNLNYDEVVVYNEEASIPQYLIVYKVK